MVKVSSNNQEEIIHFVLSRIGINDLASAYKNGITAIGAYSNSELLGGFVYTNYRKIMKTDTHSIDMHMAGNPGWLTRMTLRAFFAYPFVQLKCSRVIGSILAGNVKACKLALRLGCKQDGRVRSGISPKSDTLIFTMLRHECPWIKDA